MFQESECLTNRTLVQIPMGAKCVNCGDTNPFLLVRIKGSELSDAIVHWDDNDPLLASAEGNSFLCFECQFNLLVSARTRPHL